LMDSNQSAIIGMCGAVSNLHQLVCLKYTNNGSVKALKRAGNCPLKEWFESALALFLDPDALLL
jgi:hypothetical protein